MINRLKQTVNTMWGTRLFHYLVSIYFHYKTNTSLKINISKNIYL